jgi:2,5-diamino-6-(ribosylamino)-4(3H)-pyrimidinone 5'-phosphate reductase
LEIIYYQRAINFVDLFKRLKRKYGIDRVTIQTGGTLNAILLRQKLIDRISIVVAPALIGGEDTSSLIGGRSLTSPKELKLIKALKLIEVTKLNDSYLHLEYDVLNSN